jgi:hypothetical protein
MNFYSKNNFDYFRVFENFYIALAIVMAAFVLTYELYPILFAHHDDLQAYAVAKKGEVFSFTLNLAEYQGRFWFFVMLPLSFLPYEVGSLVVVKIVSFLSMFFSVAALGVCIYRHVNKSSGVLAVLLFFALVQLDMQHNPMVTWAFTHQIAIGLVIFAFERFLQYYITRKTALLLLSSILFFFACVIYESLLPFLLIFILVAASRQNLINGFCVSLSSLINDLRFHLFLILLYLIAFVSWRSVHPSQYLGATIGLQDTIKSLRTIIIYAFGKFPLRDVYLHWNEISSVSIRPLHVIGAFFVSSASCILLRSSPVITNKMMLYSLMVCAMGVVLPVFLLGFTPQYIEMVGNGSTSYMGSYYSFFFFIAFVSLILVWVFHRINAKYLFLLVLVPCLFISTLLTSLNNEFWSKSFALQQQKYIAFDALVSSQYFESIEDGSYIYSPEYLGIHNKIETLGWYASAFSKKQYKFINRVSDLNFMSPVYAMHFDVNSGAMLFGRVNRNLKAEEILVISRRDIGTDGSLVMNVSAGEMNKDDVRSDVVLSIKNGRQAIFRGRDIDIYSSAVLNGFEKSVISNGTFGYSFFLGWSSDEVWQRWAIAQNAKIAILNPGETDVSATVTFVISGLKNQKIKLSINGVTNKTIEINAKEYIPVNIDYNFLPGLSILTIDSDVTPEIPGNGDSRTLSFLVQGLSFASPTNR